MTESERTFFLRRHIEVDHELEPLSHDLTTLVFQEHPEIHRKEHEAGIEKHTMIAQSEN